MNARLGIAKREATYKWGPFKFSGPKLSSASVRSMQNVYKRWVNNEIPFRTVLGAAAAFKLRLL